jgi:hypothetical protein
MKRRGDSGFSDALAKQPRGFDHMVVAAQVAAEKAKADQLLKSMGHEGASQESKGPKLAQEVQQTKEMKLTEKAMMEHLMVPENQQILKEETGIDVEWMPQTNSVKLTGSEVQVKQAGRLLARVQLHCHWGSSVEKVKKLMKRTAVDSVLLRLSPMTVDKLRPVEKALSGKAAKLIIGKDKHNDVVIEDSLVSRHHCQITLDSAKGAVYIADLSTNGTFLNGKRLPSKKLGKVLLSHGDELLLHNPASSNAEFGYIVNLNVVSSRQEASLGKMRRITSPEEMSIVRNMNV